MKRSILPGFRAGTVKIPASKSMAHRLLIAAALGKSSVILHFDGFSNDIGATIVCLRALGAEITELGGGDWRVTPILKIPDEECSLFCGESGSTLRFLLPIVGVLGVRAVFHMAGRLPERPLEPLRSVLCEHGMKIEKTGNLLHCSGRLEGGNFEIPGNISSQYISGLLLALPRCKEDAQLVVSGAVESAAYIRMTEQVLLVSGVNFSKNGWNYAISGWQKFELPERMYVEGDWSNAAFFLCMGAISPRGVCVEGLNPASAQGDRAILQILQDMGAEVQIRNGADPAEKRHESGTFSGAKNGRRSAPERRESGAEPCSAFSAPGAASVFVRGGTLHGVEIDAREIPDLIPVLSVAAACTEGETVIRNAARLRLKESDRLASTAALLTALGADVTELPDGLIVRGGRTLAGGTVDPCNDHRLAMAAAVAACASDGPVTVTDGDCVNKSYPGFWDDFGTLEGGL